MICSTETHEVSKTSWVFFYISNRSAIGISCNSDIPKIVMQTSLGDIKIELYQKKAPVTVENFLQYVDSMKFEGFAAFGKVYEGLDVVRKIHQQKDSSQYLEVRIKILQIRRIEN